MSDLPPPAPADQMAEAPFKGPTCCLYLMTEDYTMITTSMMIALDGAGYDNRNIESSRLLCLLSRILDKRRAALSNRDYTLYEGDALPW